MGEPHARILVVDDEPLTRLSLGAFLRAEGFEVQTAKDGIDALSKLQGFQPDILLLDVIMPQLGGIDLLRKVRERLPCIPAVLMTGLPDKFLATAEIGCETGVACIHKPVDFDELRAVLDTVRHR